MSASNHNYDVRVDWPTVVPVGDTLAISALDGVDDRWAEAFEVVLDEHERQAPDRQWGAIDFESAGGEEAKFVLLVMQIRPQAKSLELRRTIDALVDATNTVAQVGTHVYELARELRQPQPEALRESTPPPIDPLADELDADAA